jgi:uncharacterized protein (TIGR03067 family)
LKKYGWIDWRKLPVPGAGGSGPPGKGQESGPGSSFEESAMGLMMLVVLVTGLLPGADAEKETKHELDKLQGSWILESVETKGVQLPKDKIAQNVLVIRGDKIISMSGEKVIAEATLKIDPTKSPKWIDQTFQNKEGKLVVRPGIYELTGDTLRLAFDMERPKELKTTPESNLNITTYKRQKK